MKEKEHEDRLCHGNMDHHHILMGEAYTAVIEFHKMHRAIRWRICTILCGANYGKA
ncbi:MAG: hypothetical protein V8S98_00865 [Lachnospiraceae bacterium]